MEIFELEIRNLRSQILAAENDVILLKNSSFRELQVLIELISRYNFQLSIFILQESSKRCLIFSTPLQFLRNEQICRAKSYCSITF